jgi:Ni/Co efflux regulator RcnB
VDARIAGTPAFAQQNARQQQQQRERGERREREGKRDRGEVRERERERRERRGTEGKRRGIKRDNNTNALLKERDRYGYGKHRANNPGEPLACAWTPGSREGTPASAVAESHDDQTTSGSGDQYATSIALTKFNQAKVDDPRACAFAFVRVLRVRVRVRVCVCTCVEASDDGRLAILQTPRMQTLNELMSPPSM